MALGDQVVLHPIAEHMRVAIDRRDPSVRRRGLEACDAGLGAVHGGGNRRLRALLFLPLVRERVEELTTSAIAYLL
jgi:hypothetical protein